MKKLRIIFIYIFAISIVLSIAQSSVGKGTDARLYRMQTLLNEKGLTIDDNDYIFFCTGHHGLIWSLIARDSSGIQLYNGTTRKQMIEPDSVELDSMSFVNNNIKTIEWGLDSVTDDAKLLTLIQSEEYSPIYEEIFTVKNGEIIFSIFRNGREQYVGTDSVRFDNNIKKLSYMMLWLASPSIRTYLPTPCDTQMK